MQIIFWFYAGLYFISTIDILITQVAICVQMANYINVFVFHNLDLY